MAERAGALGLVNRRGVASKEKVYPTIVEDDATTTPSTPTSSGDGSVANGEPGTFGYKIQEFDSASSLGSLADKVAEFVTPERTQEKTPHRAVGASPRPLIFLCTPRREISRARPWHPRGDVN